MYRAGENCIGLERMCKGWRECDRAGENVIGLERIV